MVAMNPLLAVSILVAAIGGALAHELTHAALAEMMGCETMLDIWNLDLYYKPVEGGLSVWEERIILLGPAVVGWGTGLGAYLTVGIPPLTIEALPLALFWGVYTLLAGPSDFSVKIARTGEWWWAKLSWAWRRLVGGYAFFVTGLAMGHVGAPYSWPDPVQWFYDPVWYSFILSAIILVLWATISFEDGGFDGTPSGQ